MFAGIRSRPCPENPWTPFAREERLPGKYVWAEFKWSMSHPKETFAQVIHGLYGTNPGLEPEVRFLAFAMMAVGGIQFSVGLIYVLHGLGVL